MAKDIDHAWRVAQRHYEAGRVPQAENFAQQVLRSAPHHAGALHLLGVAALRRGDASGAVARIQAALGSASRGRDPGQGAAASEAQIHSDLGQAYLALGDGERAQSCWKRALALDPGCVDALMNLGAMHSRRNAPVEAIECFRRAVELRPGFAMAHYNLGCMLFLAGATNDAARSFERALELEPDYTDARLNLGLVFTRLRLYDRAVETYQGIIASHPDFAQAHINLGGVLATMRRYPEAIASSRRALELRPDSALSHYNLALALTRDNQPDEGVREARKSLALRPDYFEGRVVLGQALYAQGNIPAAMACFREQLALRPDHIDGYKALTFSLLNTGGDRGELWSLFRRLAEIIEAPLRAVRERAEQRRANARDPARRLKIGYLSPDLRDHSVTTFFEPVLVNHDRERFDVYCYYSNNVIDPVAERLYSESEHWISCVWMNDEELAARIEADGIDILVDLAGFTSGSDMRVFARKPAPVQVSWLGYPSTTGLDAIDWRIVGPDTDPPGEERWHSERLYRLPRTMWCYRPKDSQREAVHEAPCVKRGGEVRFGSMNTIAKISDQAVETWSRVLHAVPGSRLVMTGIHEGESRRLVAARFAAHGIGEERLLTNWRLGKDEYTALFDDIDLALDPFPYNGTTTTCETLWRSVPVVSLEGDRSVSRPGCSLLRLVGLEALVAKDTDQYVDLAVGLARDPAHLTELRSSLRRRFEASSLRDEAGFTRDLEAAYREMWQDWCGKSNGV